MNHYKLTSAAYAGIANNMISAYISGRKKIWVLLLTATGLGLQGCVNVTAPDKPIVINLNINIKQEVVYRLAGDAKALIDENPEIF